MFIAWAVVVLAQEVSQLRRSNHVDDPVQAVIKSANAPRAPAEIRPVLAEVAPSGDIFVQPAGLAQMGQLVNASGVNSVNPRNNPLLFAVTLAGEDAVLLGSMKTQSQGLIQSIEKSQKTSTAQDPNWSWANLWQYTQGGTPSGLGQFVMELKQALSGSQLASDVGIVTESPDGTLVMYRPPSAHGVVRVMSVLLLFASAIVLGIGWRYGSTPGMYPYVEDCRL